MKKTFLSKKILIIGADGAIGSQLVKALFMAGAKVKGTSTKSSHNKFLYLDFYQEKTIAKLNWGSYDIIINCAGNINYQATAAGARANIFINVLAPLDILSRLNKNQVYFHCSTQVVVLSAKEQNSYSLSKLFFEKYAELIGDIKAKAVILRLPGIYSDDRKSGIIYLIKKRYQEKKPLFIDWTATLWHAMYLPRAVEIILSLIKNDCLENFVTIGYPAETTIEKTLLAAQKAFGFTLPVKLKKKKINKYQPDIKIQNKFIKISAADFEKDLINYFKK